jgi:cytosine/creatinine deaminase
MLPTRIRILLRLAEERGLSVDFHVDETMDPSTNTLAEIATRRDRDGLFRPGRRRALLFGQRNGRSAGLSHAGPCGEGWPSHRQPADVQPLPAGPARQRTPRRRGITLVHEMRARGINVSFASDNTRDPFYAYGDLDMLEVLREATRIGHLDHSAPDWVQSVLANPAKGMRDACTLAAPMALRPTS